MAQAGIYLMLFGIGSFLLNLFGYEFSLLMWIDNWGTEVGMGIRAAAVVAGAMIWFFAPKEENSEIADSEA